MMLCAHEACEQVRARSFGAHQRIQYKKLNFFVMYNVFISSNITSFTSEKKFDKSLTIADLKSKLELITGGNSGNMRITAFTKEDKLICELSDPHALLGSFPLDDGVRLHIEDSSKTRGEFENTANVEV